MTATALPALLLALAVATPGVAQNRATPYEQMTRLDEYLMPDLRAEIALARSAAPAGISAKATILTLKPQGYEIAADGTNGFTCLVQRGWMSPFDSPQPRCFEVRSRVHIAADETRTGGTVLAGSPVVLDTAHREVPEPETIFLVLVGHWPDGTAAPEHD